jgi:hypothetical protein
MKEVFHKRKTVNSGKLSCFIFTILEFGQMYTCQVDFI